MISLHLQNFSKSSQGWKVGQTKGICCPGAAEHRPKRPVSITAEIVADGTDDIDIKRLTRDGRPLKDKGNTILNSVLESSFTQGNEIGISASIFIDSSCRLVPADSASLAELLALLSRIADLPVRQDIVVTGLINQVGKIGASDDLDCKIEHFFDACQSEGLPELQGVMIPRAAVPDMMLRRDVIQAIENQFFCLIPVRTVEEGFQVLSGVEVGEKDDSGYCLTGTVGYWVQRCLQSHAV
jgi:predicted ATP-dependent protease